MSFLSGLASPPSLPVRERASSSPVLLTDPQLRGLEGSTPSGAVKSAANDSIEIAAGAPRLPVLLSPPEADDALVIAGLVDSTIHLPHGVTLQVSVVSLDTQDTYNWGITNHPPPFGVMPRMGSGPPPGWRGSSMRRLAGGGRYGSQELTVTILGPGTYW